MAMRRKTSIHKRHKDDWYIEPAWVSRRLFQVERFYGKVSDPFCGWGTIPTEAINISLDAEGFDISNRSIGVFGVEDFFSSERTFDNIVTNPPFNDMEKVCREVCLRTSRKAAIICPLRRLPAAHSWLSELPLARVYILTPRPSMPPGNKFIAGKIKASGGTVDYCWLVFEMSNPLIVKPRLLWLHRDH